MTHKQVSAARLQGDPAVHRRLHLASLVYNRWTERGTDPAALAARLMDGSVDALEDFVTAADDSLPEGTQQSAVSRGSSREPISGSSICNCDIPCRHANELSYDAFVLEYMAPNLPVMIEVRWVWWGAHHMHIPCYFGGDRHWKC